MAAVNITYTNQKPVELSPIVNDKINNTFDPVELLKHTAVEPLKIHLMRTQRSALHAMVPS